MKLTLTEIAKLVNGTIKGDSSRVIEGVAGLKEATSRDVTFLKADPNKKALDLLESTQAGAVFVSEGLSAKGKTLIEVKNPTEAFVTILRLVEGETNRAQSGVHPSAVLGSAVSIGKNVFVGPHVVIEDNVSIGDSAQIEAGSFIGSRSSIGAETHLHPNVTIREGSTVGQRCILHSGCVIGSDGYGFYLAGGRHNKIPQVGTVTVEDDVEIGACTTVDRATTGTTRIGRGTKIDNLVQVAHNVEIGEHSLLVAQSGIGGSSRIGKYVVLAGQVGVADHATIGDGAQIGAQAGVKDEVPAGAAMWGTPAVPIKEKIKELLLLRQLPAILSGLKRKK